MKRRKKQNESIPGQLCLFELPGIRQEEERRTKPRKEARSAFKTCRPYIYTTRNG